MARMEKVHENRKHTADACVQGYLAHKKTISPRTLPWAYAYACVEKITSGGVS